MKLLCTDLDRTLLPNGSAPECALARPILWHLIDTYSVSLAYVSGRDLVRVLHAIDEYGLRTPDFIVADVGSSLYLPIGGEWTRNENWQSIIEPDWNGLTADQLKNALRSVPGIREQEASRQSTLKTSFYFSLDADREKLCEVVTANLDSLNVKATLVMSDDLQKDIGLLDVLPKQASKSGAVNYIRGLLDASREETLFAGDSGNDVAALVSGVNAVAVANADADTQESFISEAAKRGTTTNTYQATGGLAIASGRELNGNYASGIVEGMIHFRPAWHENLLDAGWVAAAAAQHQLASPVAASKSA